jgi:hypothetical protein
MEDIIETRKKSVRPETDPYLKVGACFNRLKQELSARGTLRVVYSFSRSVWDYAGKYKCPEVIQLLRDLSSIGCTIICWIEYYEDIMEVQRIQKENNIPCDGFDDGENRSSSSESKIPCYDVLLDDRAGLSSVVRDLSLLVMNARTKPSEHYLL